MNIAANRYKNIRAAQCFNLKSTKLARLHNDANIITLGSRLLTKKNALKLCKCFFKYKVLKVEDTQKELKRFNYV